MKGLLHGWYPPLLDKKIIIKLTPAISDPSEVLIVGKVGDIKLGTLIISGIGEFEGLGALKIREG
ncbi:hypothetical protein KEJ49_00555 [Candidatus Bathyarchaeota archaeon]|nr:hypothetical protein [Candidatus Bathyarchaeota archaeon]